MLSNHILQKFYEALLQRSQKGKVEMVQLNKRASRCCLIGFTLNLVNNLDLAHEIGLGGLLIAKRVIDKDLKISKKMMHRLIVVCIFIAEKCYQEDQHSTESYSLLSGVTIKDIHLIQNKILNLLDYRILPEDTEIEYIMRGDVDALFTDRRYNTIVYCDQSTATAETNDFQ